MINPFKKISSFTHFSMRCFRFMAHDKWLFASFLVLSILAALSEGIGVSMLVPILETQSSGAAFSNIPIFSKVSLIFEGMDQGEKLKLVAMSLAAVMLVRGVLQYIVELLASIIPLRLQFQLSSKSYASLMGVEYSYVTEKDVGALTNSLTGWASGVTVLLTSVAVVIWSSLLLLMYIGLMLLLSVKMTLIAVVFVFCLSYVLRKYITAPLRNAGENLSKRNATMSEVAHETITGMKLIRQSAGEEVMGDRFRSSMSGLIETQTHVVKLQATTFPFLTTGAGLFICALLYSGGMMVDGMEEWLSGLLMFLFLIMRILGPVSQINVARNRIVQHMYFLDSLEEFYADSEKRHQTSGDHKFDGIQDNLTFDNVIFQYPQSNLPVIKGLSLKILAGEMVAIVGPSGAGKTTLISLLTRFYDPQSGSIKVDGVDMTDFDVHDLRRNVSVVSQDIFIFNDTIFNNLLFSLEGRTQADVERAAKMASAHEFIMDLPQGYETQLGDRGMRLSGGQQQRIAIARAILRNPSLLIMDEATSHLDTYTERAIQNAVEELRQNRTVLVIAHRLSTVRRADKVIVIDKGRVIEEGHHDELMKKQGSYWDMVNHQNLDLVDDETGQNENTNGDVRNEVTK